MTQPVGRGLAVEEIHRDVEAGLAEEVVRRVEPGRPRPDDRDPERHGVRP